MVTNLLKLHKLSNIHPHTTVPLKRKMAELDLVKVVKASQTISQEIVLDKLLQNLLHVFIENAIARRGILLLCKNNQILLVAEGDVDAERFILLPSIPVDSSSVPMTIINYVAITKQWVLVDDATQEGLFTNDSYIIKNKPKSILCLPIVYQNKLNGIFYLENNFAKSAFTSERVQMLKILSTQAAISLENANFCQEIQTYSEKLERQNAELKAEMAEHQRLEKTLQQSQEKMTASLQEKVVLLKEIHHRVKNNLQIVSSLLNLQSNYINEPQTQKVLQECQNRVGSMALIHEQLYKSEDIAKINFAEYVQNLVTNLVSSYLYASAIEFNIDVDRIFLSIDTAIPCGLIINELVSNSLKYAFPQGHKGEINIDFHLNKDNSFNLNVKDNGIGIPPDVMKNTKSLGLRLVTALTRQLKGILEIHLDMGTEFQIKFQNQQ